MMHGREASGWPALITDYEYLREVVKAQSANLIDPSRNALFDTRLTPMARLAGARSWRSL